MINPKQQAETDQGIAVISEVLPRLWKALYDGCVKEGFTEVQSLELVKAYIQKAGQ